MPPTTIAAKAARKMLASPDEVALIDVREAGQYGEGHPFLAVNMRYSRLELDAARLLPRHSVPIVLLDDGDGVACKAVRRLERLGFTDVAILEDGTRGWAHASYTLFKGQNVPSKAFGELLEHAADTPNVDAGDLKAWLERGDPLLLLDARTVEEHRRMNIPGSIGCPSAELGHRLPALLEDESTPIVVHCAGRTRSILGVESLRALGVGNPLYALRNGTQGWQLAGLELERGSQALYPPIGERELALSRARARTLRERHAIPDVDTTTFDDWSRDDSRTLYVFDVRTAEEFAASHLTNAVHAPGGQLVQATDHWIAVRGARIVLVDDTGLRAGLTAHWLRSMGHDAHVLDADVTTLSGLEQASEARPAESSLKAVPLSRLADALEDGALLLDLNPSMAYRAAHIDGARWGIRPRLDHLGLKAGDSVILTAMDPAVAALAEVDLAEMGIHDLRFACGGADEWRGAGLPVVATPDRPSDGDCIDYLFFVHDRHAGNLDAARGYLAWETGLVDQLDATERAIFRIAV